MPTYDRALKDRLAGATVVIGTAVGAFDPRNRRRNGPDLLRCRAQRDIGVLVEALTIDERSLDPGVDLMTHGDLQLNFMASHARLAAVVLLWPDFVRWEGFPADARLAEPRAAQAWLAAHGWSGPEFKRELGSARRGG